MQRALAWQYHLFQAGEYAAAEQIVRAVVPVLNRWGQRDMSEALLRRNVATTLGTERTPSLDDLAQLYLEQGHLFEALSVYREVYIMLEAEGARDQMAHILRRMAKAYEQVGDYDNAIRMYEKALRMMRDIGDKDGQSLCLHQLTSIYRQTGDYKLALVYGQAMKELDTVRGDKAGFGNALYEQGLILRLMDRLDNALECFRQSLKIACDVGDEALAINNLQEIEALAEDLERLDAAIDALLKVLELCQRADAREAMIILESLRTLYERQGSSEKAMLGLALVQRLSEDPTSDVEMMGGG